MNKVKVSKEIAEVLDKMPKDNWNKQFNSISHCKGFSGNGICMNTNYKDEFKVLNELQPLDFARCLIVGYEVES